MQNAFLEYLQYSDVSAGHTEPWSLCKSQNAFAWLESFTGGVLSIMSIKYYQRGMHVLSFMRYGELSLLSKAVRLELITRHFAAPIMWGIYIRA